MHPDLRPFLYVSWRAYSQRIFPTQRESEDFPEETVKTIPRLGADTGVFIKSLSAHESIL
jgi:hypothetical protein